MCLTFLLDFTSHFAESFMKEIGSQFGIVAGSRENSLYNALWVAQALLRKGYAVIYLVTLFKCHMSRHYLKALLLVILFLFRRIISCVVDKFYILFHYRSAKTADKRMLIFTNEDDPFGTIKGAVKADMARTTLQRAKVKRLHIQAHVLN